MSRWDGGVPVRQVKVYAQDGNGEHTEVKAENGALKVSLASPLSAFGELMVADNTPLVQVDAVYGLRTTDMDTVVGNGGAVTSADKLFVCSSGATSGGYASARSSRGFRYRPGQAGCARFTALFDKTGAVANNTQRAGFLCHEGSLGFGYDGTTFGVYRQTDGKTTIQTLTVDTAATGGENATVTLDGTGKTVALTAGTKAHNAYEIAQETYPGWVAKQNGDTVIFLRPKTGLTAGAFSFSSASAAATFVADQAGVDDVYDWTPQTSWSVDTLDGSGDVGNPSGMTLDTSMGNVYQVAFQYLGFGGIQYWVESDSGPHFLLVHQIDYANRNTIPNIPNPTMRIGWMSESYGATSDVVVKGASAAAFLSGPFNTQRRPRGKSNAVAGIATTYENLVAIRVRLTYSGQLHLGEVFPSVVHASADGTKPAEAALFINPTFTGETNWAFVDEAASTVETMLSAVTVSGGEELPVGSIAKSGAIDEHLGAREIRLEPGDVLCLALRATSGTTDATGSLRWVED